MDRLKITEIGFKVVVIFSMAICFSVILILFLALFIKGIDRLNWQFITSFPSRFPHKAGILPAIVGTSLIMLVTLFIAVPIGVMAGLYLEEYAPKGFFTNIIEINISNLAAVPSIIYGILALGLFVYLFNCGRTILSAGLTLSLLILPIIITATRESVRSIPNTIREASYSLGATKYQTIKNHILPYSLNGILTGVVIGILRAIGEAAPLIVVGAVVFITFLPPSPVSHNFPFFSFKWLFSPFTVLPVQIFNWVSRPIHEFHKNASSAAIVLLFITFLFNLGVVFLRYREKKKITW